MFWALYHKTDTRKSRQVYKNVVILKCENVASKVVEMVFKWHQTQNHLPGCCLLRTSDLSIFIKLSTFLIIPVLRIEILRLLSKTESEEVVRRFACIGSSLSFNWKCEIWKWKVILTLKKTFRLLVFLETIFWWSHEAFVQTVQTWKTSP